MPTGRSEQTQSILIVEDNDDDFEAVEIALRDLDRGVSTLKRCETGQDALDYLLATGNYAPPSSQPRPDLVLLDLRLPGMDGIEVLRKIKGNEDLRSIPVVVMSASTNQSDIDACYQAGANSCVLKPLEWENFAAAIACFREYWLTVSLLPKA